MSNLHPIMQAALAPFIKPLTHLRRTPPLESYTYKLNGVYLACEIEFEKGERTHGYPQSVRRVAGSWPPSSITGCYRAG